MFNSGSNFDYLCAMNKLLSGLLFFIAFSASSQKVIPLVDFNRFLKSFSEGYFQPVEFQPISEFKTGDNVCAYVDFKGNLRVYAGNKAQNITNIEAEYAVSDYLMIWKIGQTLNMWDNGEVQTLTYYAGMYKVMDSLIVYQDLRFNTVNAYYDGETHVIYTWSGEPTFPSMIGENILAYKDNGNYNKIFWHGQSFDLDVWHNPYVFAGGTDVIAFNDPINGTFAVFENGGFIDVELFQIGKYKVGNGFVVYENLNGELMLYKSGLTKKLSNFSADYWDVKDDVILWGENTYMYTYSNGEKTEVTRYKPEDYQIKNGVIAYRNFMGGVSAFIDGKVHEITNQMESEYSIHGNAVLVELFNKSYIVYKEGKSYTH